MEYKKISEANRHLLLPDWKSFLPKVELDKLKSLIDEGKRLVEHISTHADADFSQIVLPLEELNNLIHKCWGPVTHLNNVKQFDFPDLQEVHDLGAELLTEYSSFVGQHIGLFEKFKQLERPECFSQLDKYQQKIVTDEMLDFKLSGVNLPDPVKEELKNIHASLTTLQNKFTNNVQGAQEAWSKHIGDDALLDGVPDSGKNAMREMAEARGLTGYLVTLHQPIYLSIIQYANNRELRKEVYRAYVTRASDQFEINTSFDNTEVMQEIVNQRQRMAELLGYQNYNEYSLAKKMAHTVEEVTEFLNSLKEKCHAKAEKEFDELRDFAKKEYGLSDVEVWDISYLQEKMKQVKCGVDSESLRAYFPLPIVMQGMFHLVEKLFGLRLSERTDVSGWSEGVQFYELRDEEGKLRGGVYADLFATKGKRPGAWMDITIERKELNGNVELPIAYFNCNFTKPNSGEVATLRHDEVETVFHEFGHVLHHIVGVMPYEHLAMNNVEWDAVEYPSQILENWCWEPEMLKKISAHSLTKEQIPDQLVEKLRSSKLFMVGNFLVRQLALGIFDWNLHQRERGEGQLNIAQLWTDT
jgi:oligopeptidase A